MKIIKALIVFSGLFLTVNIHIASAQGKAGNDSIYGLEVSKKEKNIRFYSTYDMGNSKTIRILSYDGESDKLRGELVFYRDESDRNSNKFYYPASSAKIICEEIAKNVHKINVNIAPFIRELIPEGKRTQIELYMEGNDFVPSPGKTKARTIDRNRALLGDELASLRDKYRADVINMSKAVLGDDFVPPKDDLAEGSTGRSNALTFSTQ